MAKAKKTIKLTEEDRALMAAAAEAGKQAAEAMAEEEEREAAERTTSLQLRAHVAMASAILPQRHCLLDCGGLSTETAVGVSMSVELVTDDDGEPNGLVSLIINGDIVPLLPYEAAKLAIVLGAAAHFGDLISGDKS